MPDKIVIDPHYLNAFMNAAGMTVGVAVDTAPAKPSSLVPKPTGM